MVAVVIYLCLKNNTTSEVRAKVFAPAPLLNTTTTSKKPRAYNSVGCLSTSLCFFSKLRDQQVLDRHHKCSACLCLLPVMILNTTSHLAAGMAAEMKMNLIIYFKHPKQSKHITYSTVCVTAGGSNVSQLTIVSAMT